jgi:glycosyltransferase involved in cell wall biosynthesis
MISFVVPAYNEEKYLAATLASIHGAMKDLGEGYEIVVADDASTDATAAIAERGGARVVRVENRQIAATRNSGARASSGDMLIFVDADTEVNARVVADAVAALRAGAAGGGAGVRLETAPWYAQWVMAVFVPAFRMVGWAAGCFVYCTRTAFDRAGGFDEAYFAAEEIAFSQALKRQGRFVVLRSWVTSSSRKLENHSLGAILWMSVRLLASGRGALKKRSTTTFWYPDKR